jgi:hypothetical protein
MAQWIATTSDAEKRARLVLTIWSSSSDEANNRSYVNWTLDIQDNSSNFGGNGTSTWSANIAGNPYSGSQAYDFTGNSGRSYRLVSGGAWISHAANGTLSVGGSGTWNASGVVGSASVSGTASSPGDFPDYSRPPFAPAAPTVTRTSNAATLNVTSQVADGRGLTVTDYNWRYSTDNVNWSASQAMGTGRTASLAVTPTQQYYVQTIAASSEGWGSWSSSTFSAGIPTPPAAITTTRQARNVTVNISPSASNGGSAITTYRVQYSTDGGSTWSTAQDMNGLTYTYTNLTAGLTYLFRSFAVNSVGSSAFATSAGVFVPAGGRRWDGSGWTSTATAKRWDGTAWVDLSTAKRWDGTAWIDLS